MCPSIPSLSHKSQRSSWNQGEKLGDQSGPAPEQTDCELMDQPLSPPFKLLAERGNVAGPILVIMLNLANPKHTHWPCTLLDIHTHREGVISTPPRQCFRGEWEHESSSEMRLVVHTQKYPETFWGGVASGSGGSAFI